MLKGRSSLLELLLRSLFLKEAFFLHVSSIRTFRGPKSFLSSSLVPFGVFHLVAGASFWKSSPVVSRRQTLGQALSVLGQHCVASYKFLFTVITDLGTYARWG